MLSEKNLRKLTAKLDAELPEISRKYDLSESSTLNEAVEFLTNTARLLNIEFVYSKGNGKTEKSSHRKNTNRRGH